MSCFSLSCFVLFWCVVPRFVFFLLLFCRFVCLFVVCRYLFVCLVVGFSLCVLLFDVLFVCPFVSSFVLFVCFCLFGLVVSSFARLFV